MLAKGFAQKPPGPVSGHRVSDPSRSDHPQPAFLTALTPAPIQYQATVDHTVALLLDSRKITAAFESAGSRQADEWIGHRITPG